MPVFPFKDYPWTKQFFEQDLRQIPFLKHKRKIYEAFQDYSGLSGSALTNRFVDGWDPLVKLEHTEPDYGYTPATGNEIWLSRIFVDELETVLPANKVPRGGVTPLTASERRQGEVASTKSIVYAPSELETKLLQILESTVLHELVHYGRRNNDDAAAIRYTSKRGRAYEEAVADEFEKKAYGFSPDAKTMSVLKYLPKTAIAHHPRYFGPQP